MPIVPIGAVPGAAPKPQFEQTGLAPSATVLIVEQRGHLTWRGIVGDSRPTSLARRYKRLLSEEVLVHDAGRSRRAKMEDARNTRDAFHGLRDLLLVGGVRVAVRRGSGVDAEPDGNPLRPQPAHAL